jgi:general secretion pathway protein D
VTSPVFRKLTALAQALVMLSFAACGTTMAKKSPPPSEFKVSVAPAPEAGTPGAPGAPGAPAAQAPSPETASPPSAAPGTTPPGSAPGPAPIVPAPPAAPPLLAPPSPGSPADAGPAVRSRQAPVAPGQPAAQGPGRLVVFNFDNADVEIVLQATSELLVFNYVLAPEARGKKVTVQTTGRIPVDDIFPVLLTILDVNGLAAIKSGNVYRIIAKQGAPQTSTRTVVGAELDARLPGDEVLTAIVPLKFVSAVDLVGLLRPFVPQQAALTAHRDTNLLVITDVAANVRRLLDIVKLVDVDVTTNELQIIPLKHADAQEVGQILTQLFATGRIRPSGPQLPPGVAPPAPAPAPGAPAPPRPTTPTPTPGTADQAAERAPLIVPERRSNSLIIYARKQEMDTIRRLIEKLDADIYGGQRVYFYFVENTKAKDLAATLDAIFGRGTGAAPTTPQQQPTRPGAPGLPSQTQVQPPRPTAATAPGVQGLLGEGVPGAAETRFIPDEVTNSIIVTTYPRVWSEIEQIIKKLDRMPRQVLIEVLAVEVTLDQSTSLGIEWAIQRGRFSGNFTSLAPSSGVSIIPGRPPQLSSLISSQSSLALTGLNFFTFAANEFLLAINALATEDKVNVLSSPSIMTAENKKAVINVSRSVPILTSQQVPIGGAVTSTGTSTGIVGTQTVEYKDAGIVLTVTPRIGEQGTVALDVKQEVNDVGQPVPPTQSPEFQKREAETSVVLLNNQTLVLGGLIQTRKEIVKSGIPYLNKIPVLGYLFGNTSETVKKTELILLITPRVVGTAIDATRVTDQLRRITPEIKDSIKEKQFPYPSFEYLRP